MFKRVFIRFIAVYIGVGGVLYLSGTNINQNREEIVELIYGDERLSLFEYKKGIELKISILYEDVIKFSTVPNKSQLEDLVKNIKTLRAYGRDISRKSKSKLLKTVEKLLNDNYQDISILKEIIQISKLLKSS